MAKAKHIAGIWRLNVTVPSMQPSFLSQHSQQIHQGQGTAGTPVTCPASKEPGCGWELPWAGGAAGVCRLSSPHLSPTCNSPQIVNGNQK